MKNEGFLLAGYMTAADGVVSAEEKAFLKAEFNYEGVEDSTKEEVYKILGNEEDAISLDTILSKIKNFSKEDKKEILEYNLKLGFSDNEFSEEEQTFFEDVCDSIGYPKSNFDSLISDLEEDAKAAKMAEKFGKNATEDDIQNVEDKMDGMKKGPLAKIWDKVLALWKGFNSKDTPAYMKAIIIGGLIYMVTPVDLVPDFIPIAGLLDDCGVIGIVFRQFIKIGVFGLAAGVVVQLVKITKKEIIKDLKENNKDAVSAMVKKCKKEGDFTFVDIGLRNEDGEEIGTKTYKSEDIADDIKEGEEILVA